MSGRRKPTALKIFQGTDREDRTNKGEPQLEPAKVSPPRGSKPGWRGPEWSRLMPCLYETGVMTRMDRGVFAAYCAAYAEFVFFELQLETAEAVAVSENGFAYSNGPGRGDR